MAGFWRAGRMFLWMTVLTGVVYPLLITAVALGVWSDKARGSFVVRDGAVVGSRLIGQPFREARYFWGRPSERPGGASNLCATSKTLRELVEGRRKALSSSGGQIPPELLYASASGLDPQISPAGARFQIARVAAARGFSPDKTQALEQLVDAYVVESVWGVPCVNVLELNIALDRL